jgi:tetratricopeptide (TPR) repeat protein
MRLRVFLVMMWLGLWSVIAAHAATAADAILTQANTALVSGQYSEAKTLAATALSEPALPELTRSRLMVVRALAQQALGVAEDALLDFTIALQGGALQGEERARALFARGLSLDGQGRLEAALGDYSAALAVSSRATYALNNRSNVYRRQGLLAEAKRDYAAALAAETPNPQYPWYGLGQIAENEGDIQTARGLYARALAYDPGFQLALERLQVLGAAEVGSVSADAGIIVLRPPRPKAETAIALLPLSAHTDPVAIALKPPPAWAAVPLTPASRRDAPLPQPGRGMPLRPAIAEGASLTGPMVQLGAWRSEAEARTGWAAARAGADGLLDSLTPVIVRADLPLRGTYYRLRVPARGTPGAFCSSLEGKGLKCLPVQN